jgi:hypothetical protein
LHASTTTNSTNDARENGSLLPLEEIAAEARPKSAWRSRWAITFYCWLVSSCIVLLLAGYTMISEDASAKTLLLPGKTTHGHYQIEMSCSACHTPTLGVRQDACLDCHAAELKLANDTHPAKKFNDPTNADRLAILNAKKCITCHREHVPQQTQAMGLSLPADYCFHCHQDVQEQRPSHKDLTFDSCATAGCHNYHDNTALYENFLAQHWGETDTFDSPLIPFQRDTELSAAKMLSAINNDGPDSTAVETVTVRDWAASAHAQAGVNCSACHVSNDSNTWSIAATDSQKSCGKCHAAEVVGFQSGRHGMRLSRNLPPLTPAEARLPMKKTAAHRKLNCLSCHSDHSFDTKTAAVDACVGCHNDSHTLAYKQSSHYALWQAELRGDAPVGSGVSCATCHLPRDENEEGDYFVEHNQNMNLRPNEKMVRNVCNHCHGVAFSLDALADPELIKRCFQGRPNKHIESVDMAKKWFEAKSKKNQSRQNDRAVPKQPAPKQPAPKQPAPKQPAPKQPAPKQPAPKQPAPKQPSL